MNFLKMALVATIFLFSLAAQASPEIVIFRTFEDFQNEKGETYDKYVRYTGSPYKGAILVLKNNNKEKFKIKCKEIFGFIYKGAFFRVSAAGHPARVMSAGKIIHYENGTAHLNMLFQETDQGMISLGAHCYLSSDINSEMIAMPAMMVPAYKKMMRKFKAENPQYDELFECIEQDYGCEQIRMCIEAYEGEEATNLTAPKASKSKKKKEKFNKN